MKNLGKQILYWLPRVLGILFVLFVSIFALDVFGQGYGFWETLLALLVHLIPSFILLAVVALAWRWGWVGAILYTGFGVWYLISSWGKFHWSVYLIMVGIPVFTGLLFLADWWYRRRLTSNSVIEL